MKILAHFVVLGMSIYQVFGQESLPTVAVIIGGYDLGSTDRVDQKWHD